MYSNQSFGEKPSVINNLSNKLDAVNKKDLESMDDDRSVSPSPSSLSYPVTPPKTPEDGSEDSMSVSSVCSPFVSQIFFFFFFFDI